jgi:hypothetical protein
MTAPKDQAKDSGHPINPSMTGALGWNANTTLQGVQFEWEDKPIPRPVRLTSPSPKEGEPVRITIGGAEVECVIVRSLVGVLHVRLAKGKMQKAVSGTLARRKSCTLGAERKAAKKR